MKTKTTSTGTGTASTEPSATDTPTSTTTTEPETAATPAGPTSPTTGRARRARTSRKRSRFSRCPRPAIPVRGLWEQASEAERTSAHRSCMAILEYWLGKSSKAQIAARLEVPPLRVWQLSQQALSGMLAGLLR